MPKVKLKKIFSTHKNLRTDEITGECLGLPQEGCQFKMTAEALDEEVRNEGGLRHIWTSPVQTVVTISPSQFRFFTANSTYEIEVLEG